MNNRSLLICALFAAAFAAPVCANESSAKVTASDRIVMESEGFLASHPDLRWRNRGIEEYDAGNYAAAMKYFRRAARFADKPSQGMISQMLLDGNGVAADPALAYAWMDLAAERGYRPFAIRRERIWQTLDEAQRARALEEGKTIYAEYADEVAKPRLEGKLRLGRKQVTGSRTGSTGSLSIQINTPSGMITVDGSNYYREEFWEPEKYWAWQDQAWYNPPRGVVDVGPLSNVPATEPAKDAAAEPKAR